MISNVMRTHDWSWQVVGITPNALEVYKRDHWRHQAGNAIQRAHITDRKDMIRHIFDREIPMSESKLLDYWIPADQTVLATKSENSNGLPAFWHKFDANGLFRDRGTGFKFTIRDEGEFLKCLARSSSELNEQR